MPTLELRPEYELLHEYLKLYNQKSINNETAGLISFFVIMGQVFKNKFIVPVGDSYFDVRVSFFWAQGSRSGK